MKDKNKQPQIIQISLWWIIAIVLVIFLFPKSFSYGGSYTLGKKAQYAEFSSCFGYALKYQILPASPTQKCIGIPFGLTCYDEGDDLKGVEVPCSLTHFINQN